MPIETIGDQTGATYSGCIDSYLQQASDGDNNFGSSDLLEVTKFNVSDYKNGVIAFPGVSNIVGPVDVSVASFYFYADEVGGDHTISAYQLLRNWIENEVTWNVCSTGNNWGAGGGTLSSTDRNGTAVASVVLPSGVPGYKQFTSAGLAALVEGWINGTIPNYGLLLERTDGADDNRYTVWRSREHATANTRPYLEVTYSIGGGDILMGQICI